MTKPSDACPYAPLQDRKGARRRSEVPPAVLEGLHRGRLQTVNLVEWLAIDVMVLLENVLDELGLETEAAELLAEVSSLSAEGINRKMEGVAQALFARPRSHRRRDALTAAIQSHTSDVVRCWGANLISRDPDLKLKGRLAAIRPLAADPHFGVREAAWMALRPHLALQLDEAIRLLRPWTKDRDPNIRRFAIESTRPRGVWCAHIHRLREFPEDALALLEPVRSDGSRYVQLSVANWLNDASKTRSDWTEEICSRWLLESPTAETAWIVHHARRTLRKQAAQPKRSSRLRSKPAKKPT